MNQLASAGTKAEIFLMFPGHSHRRPLISMGKGKKRKRRDRFAIRKMRISILVEGWKHTRRSQFVPAQAWTRTTYACSGRWSQGSKEEPKVAEKKQDIVSGGQFPRHGLRNPYSVSIWWLACMQTLNLIDHDQKNIRVLKLCNDVYEVHQVFRRNYQHFQLGCKYFLNVWRVYINLAIFQRQNFQKLTTWNSF